MQILISAVLAILILSSGSLSAQDVELYYEMNGQRPPDGYYEQLRRDPNSFRFETEGFERLERIRGRGFQELAAGAAAARSSPALSPAFALGPREAPVVGTVRIPVILGLFSDGPLVPPYSAMRVQQEYFDGPNSYLHTIPQLYTEMSGGLLNLETDEELALIREVFDPTDVRKSEFR
jgi:hypothetical protein